MKNIIVLILVFCFSCQNEYTPKPQAKLRLEYPKPSYEIAKTSLPFTFEKNKLATKLETKKLPNVEASYAIDVSYPSLKGTIYLTYKGIANSEEKLIRYLQDAQNFTQKHTQKADEISERPFINKEKKVYGMFYEVGGNAASQSQFYVTDSTNHFLTGSLYFYTKPNYDSILPAANYLQKDIQRIMETVEWQ
ncbi:MAG: gliding motility lipoprotein GldD [Oceanihabitans sp.]